MKIPKGWDKALLHELAHVQTGLSKSEGRTGPSVRKPYLRVANVQDGFLDLSELKEIDVPVAQVDRFRLQLHDVLLTEGGDFDKLGRGCVWRNEVPDCVHQNHIFAVRVTKPQELLPQFLACQIQSAQAKSYFMSCSKQTTNLASINSSQIKKLPVLLPPLLEQRAIVHAASIWDAAIKTMERLIAAVECRYHEISQDLIWGNSYPSIKISNLVERVSRKNIKGNGRPLTVSGRNGLISQSDYFEKRIAAESTEHYTLLYRGEFAYNRSYMKGYPYGAIKRLDKYDEGIVSTLCLCFSIKPDALLDSNYLVHFCEVGGFNREIHKVAQEGARNHGLLNIAMEDFFGLKMPLPPLEKQRTIAAVLDTAEREISLLRIQLAAIREQKRGLMQKLLTGQWQLKAPSTEAA